MPYQIVDATGALHEVPRVTEVVKAGMPRPELAEWELRNVAKWAAEHPSLVRVFGVDKAISEVRKVGREKMARGTAVHRYMQALFTGEAPPALLRSYDGYKRACTDFLTEYGPVSPALVEQTLTDDGLTVAGTADLIARVGPWGAVLLDWKTVEDDSGGDLWPDQLAQLGAYASMACLVDDGKVAGPAPFVTQAAVVRLCSTGRYRVLWATVEEAKDHWRAVRRVARATTEGVP